jgi:hypothetical protein
VAAVPVDAPAPVGRRAGADRPGDRRAGGAGRPARVDRLHAVVRRRTGAGRRRVRLPAEGEGPSALGVADVYALAQRFRRARDRSPTSARSSLLAPASRTPETPPPAGAGARRSTRSPARQDGLLPAVLRRDDPPACAWRIPARVAAGFTPGTRDGERVSSSPATSTRTVGRGVLPRHRWVTFDPTRRRPAARAARGPGDDRPRRRGGLHARRGGERQTGIANVDEGAAGAAACPPRSSFLTGLLLAAAGNGARCCSSPPPGALERARGPRAGRRRARERALRRAGRPLRPGRRSRLEHELRGAPDAAGYVGALRRARYGWAHACAPRRPAPGCARARGGRGRARRCARCGRSRL